jgi:hypothetical protein
MFLSHLCFILVPWFGWFLFFVWFIRPWVRFVGWDVLAVVVEVFVFLHDRG